MSRSGLQLGNEKKEEDVNTVSKRSESGRAVRSLNYGET